MFHIIIPARYASSRLPGKMLADIAGKPMLQQVYERALASDANSVVIATDDERIQNIAESFGATVCMTKTSHQSGTERLAEAVEILGLPDEAIVVNVQGDEPLISPINIRQVAMQLTMNPSTDVATLCEPIHMIEEIFDPNVVKVVMNAAGHALYFSRAPIPWNREKFNLEPEDSLEPQNQYRHIGLYAYRAGFIQQYVRWQACELEKIEALEQLRVLWYGGRIHVSLAEVSSSLSVDTEQDLLKVRAICEALQ